MVMLKRKQVILAKIETTYGVDPTPTAGSDAILALNPEIKDIREPVERNVNISTLSNKPAVLGTEHVELTFQVELKGSGTAGTAPRLGALLEACSMSEAIISSTSVTYTPVSSSQSSVTIYAYIDGRMHEVNGARGTVKLNLTAGQMGMLDFTFQGLRVAPITTAIVSGTYDTPNPPVCKACTFTYDSKTTLISKDVEIDLANTIAKRKSLSATTGFAGVEITERKPTMVFNVEAQLETSYTFRDDQLSSQKEVSLEVGGTAGNIITITVPKYNITTIDYADEEGILLETLTGECVIDSTGDDELTIVFT